MSSIVYHENDINSPILYEQKQVKLYLTIIQRQANKIEIPVDLQLLESEKRKWQQVL